MLFKFKDVRGFEFCLDSEKISLFHPILKCISDDTLCDVNLDNFIITGYYIYLDNKPVELRISLDEYDRICKLLGVK